MQSDFPMPLNGLKTTNATEQPKDSNLVGFKSAMALATWPGSRYTGLLAATWVPMGAGVAVLSPNDDPNPAQRPQGWER